MLPRDDWRGVYHPFRVGKARGWLNNVTRRSVISQGGRIYMHPGIMVLLLHLLRPDGVHLSAAGSDIFLADLQIGLCDLSVQVVGRELRQGHLPPWQENDSLRGL